MTAPHDTGGPALAPPRAPLARLAAGLVVACALLTAAASAISWGVYALNFDDAYGVAARTGFAAQMIGIGLGVFSVTAAPLGIAGALALGRRSVGAFALAGAVAGAAFGGLGLVMSGGGMAPAALVALAAIGALHLMITRAVAGVRRKA
ncbi:MAG: hypothetical protein ACJA1L_002325 [Paracoccaceae bacterium]